MKPLITTDENQKGFSSHSKSPVPILKATEKCRENKGLDDGRNRCKILNHKNCKGTGSITTTYTPLRDFERYRKGQCLCGHFRFKDHRWDWETEFTHECKKCDCKKYRVGYTSYKIPFKSYEIKKVSEIKFDEEKNNVQFKQIVKLNQLKDEDKLVIVIK